MLSYEYNFIFKQLFKLQTQFFTMQWSLIGFLKCKRVSVQINLLYYDVIGLSSKILFAHSHGNFAALDNNCNIFKHDRKGFYPIIKRW